MTARRRSHTSAWATSMPRQLHHASGGAIKTLRRRHTGEPQAVGDRRGEAVHFQAHLLVIVAVRYACFVRIHFPVAQPPPARAAGCPVRGLAVRVFLQEELALQQGVPGVARAVRQPCVAAACSLAVS